MNITSKNLKNDIFELRKKETRYCVCIPLLNEGEKFKKQLIKMKLFAPLADILVLDGGSTDGSADLKPLKGNGIRALLVKRVPGKYSTQLRMGFAYALKQGYKGIIQIDGNNKDGVEAIPEFIKALDEGYDYIQGSRFIKGGKAINTPPLRQIGIRLVFSPLLSLASGFWFSDITNGFRAYSSKLLSHPQSQPQREIFSKYELLFYLPVRAAQLDLKVKEIPVIRKYPRGKVPTKITGVFNHLNFFLTAIKVALNCYSPSSSTIS